MLKFLVKKKKEKENKKNNIIKGEKPKNRLYMITDKVVDNGIDESQPVSILDELKK